MGSKRRVRESRFRIGGLMDASVNMGVTVEQGKRGWGARRPKCGGPHRGQVYIRYNMGIETFKADEEKVEMLQNE